MKNINIKLNDEISEKIDLYKSQLALTKSELCAKIIESYITACNKVDIEKFILGHNDTSFITPGITKDDNKRPYSTLDVSPNTHEPYILDCDSISIAQDDITSDITDEEFVRDHMYDACTHNNDLCTYTNIDTNHINTDDCTHVAIDN